MLLRLTNKSIWFALRVSSGDFDIPSSREDVDRDSPWNQWLRSEVPQLFVQALNVFNVRRANATNHTHTRWASRRTR